jgi:hypothetical protein
MSEVGFEQSAAFYPTRTGRGYLTNAFPAGVDFQTIVKNHSIDRPIIKRGRPPQNALHRHRFFNAASSALIGPPPGSAP